MEELRFNTAIAFLMTYYNFLSKQASLSLFEVEAYLKMLAPFAPHMTEELFSMIHTDFKQIGTDKRKSIGNQGNSIHTSAWPQFEDKYLAADMVRIPVQVNGKLRGMLEVSADNAKDHAMIEKMATEDAKVAKFLKDQKIKKLVYIEGKVINFVTDSRPE